MKVRTVLTQRKVTVLIKFSTTGTTPFAIFCVIVTIVVIKVPLFLRRNLPKNFRSLKSFKINIC